MKAVKGALEWGIEFPGDVRATERETVLGTYQVVDLYRVFPQVGEVRLRHDPVGGALLEPGRRQRESVQERSAVRADQRLRDDVVRELLLRGGIGGDPSLAKEDILRIQQFTEIPVAHGRRGDGAGRGVRVAPLDPFLGPEEKQFAAIGVEVIRHEDGAADVKAVLVRVWTLVAGPGVRVQRRIAEILYQVAVEVPSPALGHEADLAAGGAAVFGGVIGGEDLHLGNGVHILSAEHRAGGARARGDGAVHRHQVFVPAAAVDAEAAVADAVGIERADGAAAHARLQQRQIDRIAAVQRQILDLPRLDDPSDLPRFGLHLAGRGGHLHYIGQGAHSQVGVYADLRRCVELDLALHEFLEARSLGGDGVGAHHQRGEDVIAVRVRSGPVQLAIALVGGGDVRSDDDRSRGIAHEP